MAPTKTSTGRFLQAALQALPDRGGDPPRDQGDTRADIYYEEIRLHASVDQRQGPYVMPIVTLRTRACGWALRGGCAACGYHVAGSAAPVADKHILAQTADAIERIDPSTYHSLVFTSTGSFLDPAEVSDELRPRLLRRLRRAGFGFVVMETRPEFVRRQRVQDIIEAFAPGTAGARPLSLSLGLESADDWVLDHCVHKGLTVADYLDAFAILRDLGVSFDCYVMLGKPFLDAEQDIEDARRAVQFAASQGADYVFVMVTNLARGSLTHHLHHRGRYRLPSLWRAVDLLERLSPEHRRLVLIKGYAHAPVPVERFAGSCPQCEARVRDGLDFWNQTGDFEHLRRLPRCGCRDRERVHVPGDGSPGLAERVRAEYERLAGELRLPPSSIPLVEDPSL